MPVVSSESKEEMLSVFNAITTVQWRVRCVVEKQFIIL